MKKIIIFLVTELFTLSANAQMYLDVVSQLKHLGSVASKDVVNDNDGNPCAKIMFEMSVNDVTFSSPNLVGDSSKKTGRYECFVSVSQKQGTEIEIKHPDYGCLSIPLWCDGKPLISREAYHVKIDAKVYESYYRKFAEELPFYDDYDESEYPHRTEIPEVSLLDTKHVNNMSEMFNSCTKLAKLDIKHFDTSNVTNMSFMFHFCTELKSINLYPFNTSKVTNMAGMFRYCSSLTSLNLKNFDTSNVLSMSDMFGYCENMITIDLHSFNTSKVQTMSSMFGGCSNIQSLNLSNFNTSNVTDMSSMFSDCKSLTSLDLKKFDTSNVTDMSAMFLSSGIISIDLSSFNTRNVTSFVNMFADCSKIESINLSNFVMSITSDCDGMFRDCNKLKTIKALNCNQTTINKIKEALSEAGIQNQVRLIK